MYKIYSYVAESGRMYPAKAVTVIAVAMASSAAAAEVLTAPLNAAFNWHNAGNIPSNTTHGNGTIPVNGTNGTNPVNETQAGEQQVTIVDSTGNTISGNGSNVTTPTPTPGNGTNVTTSTPTPGNGTNVTTSTPTSTPANNTNNTHTTPTPSQPTSSAGFGWRTILTNQGYAGLVGAGVGFFAGSAAVVYGAAKNGVAWNATAAAYTPINEDPNDEEDGIPYTPAPGSSRSG